MIGLVGCSAQKLDRAAPARELYCSRLFRLALAYAESRCRSVYVISAELGLVELDAPIEPYNRRLAGKREREDWGRRIADPLTARHGCGVDYMLLAGRDYADPLAAALRAGGVRGDRILTPLAGMQIGQRLQWLAAQRSALPVK